MSKTMMAKSVFLTIVFIVTRVSSEPEQVWLRDLNSDLDRRNLASAGLPSSLKFRLSRRNNGPGLELDLKENKRLNQNAPLFQVEPTSDGKQRVVAKDAAPILTTKFYQDKQNGGAFQVACETQSNGACQRKLYGNFHIFGRSYNLKPVPNEPEPSLHGKRGKSIDEIPHVLIPSDEEGDRPRLHVGYNNVADYVEIPDRRLKKRKELLEELKALLSKKQKDAIARNMRRFHRRRRSNNVYAVEILVAVDPSLWNKYYETTSAGNGLTRDEATEFRLRQHFAHIINGVSLRYEAIEDPEMNIYVTLSGFLFYKTLNSTNPLPPSTNIPVINGVQYADANVYINSLTSWASSLQNLPHNDHIAVFTGYELYTDITTNDGVAGKAWVGGVCNNYRTSINEDGSYFVTVSVAAHEIGHNLNSAHDGSGTSSSCTGNDKFIMANMVTTFYPGQDYTVNPWRFSQCSIDAFKEYVNSLGSGNCLLDHGDYYDATEYSSHVTLLPGELHSPDEQCKLVRGDGSGLCSDSESEDICTTMLCKGENNECWYYAAARGTPCGPAHENKWCIEGLCVARSSTYTDGGNYGGHTNTSTNGGTQVVAATEIPVQISDGSEDCVDHGWEDWSCQKISDYFYNTYSATSAQWCTDPTWSYNCCVYCSGGGQAQIVTTTTTTEAPTTPPSGDECVDIGWTSSSGTWSCQRISDYFLSTYGYDPTYWCLDPEWKYRCCSFCTGYGI